jgi:transcriptional regulator with XRE-family HTH domain
MARKSVTNRPEMGEGKGEGRRDRSVGRLAQARDGDQADAHRAEPASLRAISPEDRDETEEGEQGLTAGGYTPDEYAVEVTDPENPFYHQFVLAALVKKQIQTSPLTPAEIAERADVSVSQIYRFIKGERSLTLETADKILPIVARSFVEKLRDPQGEVGPRGFEEEIEDEKERLRRRLERWEKTAFEEAREIMKDLAKLADRMQKVIDDL